MVNLQKLLEKQINSKVPRLLLQRLVEKKLQGAGVKAKPKLVDKIVSHILNGSSKKLKWNDGSNVDKCIKLSFSKEDVADIEEGYSRLTDSLPEILEKSSSEIAKVLFRSLRKRWSEEYFFQQEEFSEFRVQLEWRWGKALGLLRMLLTISREFGSGIASSNPPNASHLRNVLTRLHARACQVTAEIITLLENGYADGAMARWRTLHEISIVMALIKEHGEQLAERYIAHQAIDAKNGKDQYLLCYEQLGYQPLGLDECREIDKEYELAISKYGKEFRGPYGWTAGYVAAGPSGRIGLGELEAAAGRSEMASYYKFASHNVHAGSHALFFRLGLMGEAGLLAGASNAGLMEPGQNTAFSLTLVSVLLVGDNVTLDSVVAMKTMQLLRDKIPIVFAKADRRLKTDHERYSKKRMRRKVGKNSP